MNRCITSGNLLLLGLLLGGCSTSPTIVVDNHSSAKSPVPTVASSPSASQSLDKNIYVSNVYHLSSFSPVNKMDMQKNIAFLDAMTSIGVYFFHDVMREYGEIEKKNGIKERSISVFGRDARMAIEKGITPPKKECRDIKYTSEDSTVAKYLSKYQIDAKNFREWQPTDGNTFEPVPTQTPPDTKAVILHTNCDLPGLQEILLVGYEKAELDGFNNPYGVYLYHDGAIFMGVQAPRL